MINYLKTLAPNTKRRSFIINAEAKLTGSYSANNKTLFSNSNIRPMYLM